VLDPYWPYNNFIRDFIRFITDISTTVFFFQLVFPFRSKDIRFLQYLLAHSCRKDLGKKVVKGARRTAMEVYNLRCEYKRNPIGIDLAHPRLSWQLVPGHRDLMQSAYQIQVASQAEDLEKETSLVWDTGKIHSVDSVNRKYEGPGLNSGQRCYWRVRIWDEKDQVSSWSEPGGWEMGLLEVKDWKAKWIDPEGDVNPKAFKPCPYLRRTFEIKGLPITRARVYITCHGVYELSINGKVIGDQVLPPGFTSYHKRLQYQTYDITERLQSGENVVGVILGDGWYRGSTDALSFRNVYGDRLALLLQIYIQYGDHSEQWVVSDQNWKTSTGPLMKSDLKDGEIYDARLEMPGWDQTGFDDRAWKEVKVVDFSFDNLVASNGLPICRRETFVPEILHTPDGGTVLDLGQNIAGRMRMKVQGLPGTIIKLTHGEVLDQNGNFTMKNFEASFIVRALTRFVPLLQEDTYILKGGEPEIYEPRFTYHGFRYIKVEGYPGQPTPDQFTGIAIYSDMPQTGEFECSHPLVTRLQKNIEWSMKGNFVDIPTDCPQRERSGWTGDAQVFSRTGSFIMETVLFYEKWLRDLAVDQRPNGLVPNVIPDPSLHTDAGIIGLTNGSSGWADAALIIPWTVYQFFGDKTILANQYPSMKAWVDYIGSRTHKKPWTKKLNPVHWGKTPDHWDYLWDTGYHWGEWLEPDVNPFIELIKNFLFSRPQVATAYYAYSSSLLSRAAQVLGKDEDAQHYHELSEKIKSAWLREFVTRDGRIKPDRQASYVRALAFDLLPEGIRPKAAKRLIDLIQAANYHIGTGFLSTPFICHVLSQYGYTEVAYKLLLQEGLPSWLYEVSEGATTTWEFWNAIGEDGRINMSSHNHYSPGSIGSWLYEVVAGMKVDPHCPGFKHFYIQPQPGGNLTQAQVRYQSLYGEIHSAWEISQDCMHLAVQVPPNTLATVRLPHATLNQVKESDKPLSEVAGVHEAKQVGMGTEFDLGSGSYLFEYPIA
jgi:alpha-L-rhamnosidase